MESSIAVFLKWQSACELLPTAHHEASYVLVELQADKRHRFSIPTTIVLEALVRLNLPG